MAGHYPAARRRAMENLFPGFGRSHVKHHQSQGREHCQQRIEIRIYGSGRLSLADCDPYDLHLFERNAAQRSAAQESSFVEDLAHPCGRNPRRPLASSQETLDDAANQLRWIAAGSHRIPHICDERAEALFHDRVQKLTSIGEVVMDHGWSHPGTLGDGGEAGRGHPVSGKELGGGSEQQLARVAIRIGDGPPRLFRRAGFLPLPHN